MSNILNGITEAKRSPEPDYNDPSWDEKVSNVGQKAKQAEVLKSKGKEPKTRWNPETKKYYVDFSDVDESVGIPYPGTYEETNDMFKSGGQRRVGTLTTEEDVTEAEEQGIDNKYRRAAKEMINVYNTNPEIKAKVDASTDPLEAMVYTTGVIKNPDRLTGTTHMNKLMTELESIYYYGREQGVAEGSKTPSKFEITYKTKDGTTQTKMMIGKDEQSVSKYFEFKFRHKPISIKQVEKQGVAEAHGNYAGDTPVNLGGVSMKMIQTGDTVKYIDQKAQVVDMSPDRKYSRITIPSSSTTKTVLTSDLRQLGQGMAEGWSQKYKKSINCSHPKGFSQKTHCAGKKKHNESVEMEMVCEDCGMCETHSDHENLDEACWKGYHKEGNKKMFGKTYPNCVKNTNEEQEHSESCPHCGSELVSEELMNEKKDACYYKVKSRYKVWPSAYASGALVKCRKKGADSWGNGGKKNESSILEGIEQVDESLHDWFNKEKWVRMDTKGNIKGPCAKEPGEGKPKCLPQSKAHSLGKKGRASAAARKRREDPNPDRSGKAINVNTKKESAMLEGLNQIDEGWKSALGSAALAGAMALGAGAAHGRVVPGQDDPGINRLTGKPIATQVAQDNEKPAAKASSGYSAEYLQSVIDGKHPRPMLSVEKAKQLLQQQGQQ